jgi:hypothetical protein
MTALKIRALRIRVKHECTPRGREIPFLDIIDHVHWPPIPLKLFFSGNPIGSCQRSLCECDLSFALELEENRKYYQESNSKWKGFQSNQECTASGQNLGARSNLINQTPVPVPEELLVHNGFACCGTNYDN